MDWDDEPNLLPELDLHGMPPDKALRRLQAELHTSRVRDDAALVVITGQGYGNRLQQPILRSKVEAWLDGPEGRAMGVLSWTRNQPRRRPRGSSGATRGRPAFRVVPPPPVARGGRKPRLARELP